LYGKARGGETTRDETKTKVPGKEILTTAAGGGERVWMEEKRDTNTDYGDMYCMYVCT
jgi:hypothetical protein